MKTCEYTVQPEDVGKRIDKYLPEQEERLTRSFLKKMIDNGNLTVNDKQVPASYKLKSNDHIILTVEEPKPLEVVAQDIPLDIVYEDDSLLVVNKPQGMVVHPANGNYEGTLVNALMAHCKGSLSAINGVIRPGIVHRIDKDTSGLLLVAKTNEAHLSLAKQLKEHTIERRYIALVHGNIKEDTGTVDAPLGRHPADRKKRCVTHKNAKSAVTHFTVIKRLGQYTLVECRLETGRTHQIRVHMAYIKHPLVGDSVYGVKKQPFPSLNGQMLHAIELGFVHPETGEFLDFVTDYPPRFEKIIALLEKN